MVEASRTAAVYMAYDIQGLLLYVGFSVDPTSRIAAHRARTAWWNAKVSYYEITWYDTLAEASTAERSAIERHRPPFNKAGITRRYSVPSVLGVRRTPSCEEKLTTAGFVRTEGRGQMTTWTCRHTQVRLVRPSRTSKALDRVAEQVVERCLTGCARSEE